MKALALAEAAAESGHAERALLNISYQDIFGKRAWARNKSGHPDGYSIADLTRQGGGTARRISYEDLKQLAKPGRPVIAYLDTPRPPQMYAALNRARRADVPSLTGHFVVVEQARDGFLEALDPINGRERWDACMFQARWSGIVVLLPGTSGQHGQPLPSGLADTLRGGCCGSPPPDPCGGEVCAAPGGGGPTGPCGGVGGPGGGTVSPMGSAGGCPSCGAPAYRFGLATANLVVMDTPMWYPDVTGPEMRIHLVHNRINSGILSDTNTLPLVNYYAFGKKWSFNFSSFVRITPGNNVDVVMPDGRVFEYLPLPSGGFTNSDIRTLHTLSIEGSYYRLTLDDSHTSYYYSTDPGAGTGQQVERITDRFGQTVTLQYDGTGKLTNIVDAVGRFFALSYNGAGYVTNVTDALGRSSSFEYANGNLISMTDMGGYTTTLQYDNHNWITNVVYPNTSALRMTYETNGTQIAQHDSPDGWMYDVYESPFRIRVINSLNQTNEYMYHAFYTSGPATVRDASGNIWDYAHDSWQGNNKTPAIKLEGVNDSSYNTDAPDGIADQWVFRGFGGPTHDILKETQPATAVQDTYGPVENGLVRNFTYDANHWLITETWVTNNITVGVWSNAYDNARNRIYARDPLGAITRTVYKNNLPVAITNAMEAVTKMEYDGGGNLTRSINPRLAETTWAYDERGLSTNTTLPDGTSYSMKYDSIGRLTGVADPVGLTVSNVYDNLDRITDVIYPDSSRTHYNFSCCGLDSVIDRLNRQTTYEHDILGRVTNVTDAANQRVGFRYGPGGEITNLIVWVDGQPRTTKFDYTSTNGFTRLTQRTSPLGKTTGYDYWFRGWLKERKDGANRQTQYQYDVLGRLKEINYPGNTNVTMSYDAVGHVTSLANNNASSTFKYDLLGRLTNTTVNLAVPGMTAVSYGLEYQYDSAGNVTNRTLRMGGSGASLTIPTRYEYDLMNRLTLVTNSLASASYGYTSGRLTSKVYGNGDWVSYDYDLESRLTNLTIWAGALLQGFGYTYDAMGMMRSQDSKSLLGAGYSNQSIDYGYDAVYQLTSEVVRVNNGAGVTNKWTYDAAGNVKTASGKFGTAQATVNADNELVDWTQGVQQITVTGQVDPGANNNNWFGSTASVQEHDAPVSMQDGSFAIPGVPVNTGANALTATVTDVSGNVATQIVNNFTVGNSQSSTFSYDENGNLSGVSSASGNWTYNFDAENRLVKAVSNSVVVLQCWYDGFGRRVAKREIIGTQTNMVQYVWDGWNLVAVLGEDGSLKEFYTRGVGVAGDIGTLIAATYYASGVPSATRYLHNNHRGDVIMARQGTNTVAALDYGAYGELRNQAGSYAPRFRFSSKEYDAGVGFYHFPYRYYAPEWGRWITRDPRGLASIAAKGGMLEGRVWRYITHLFWKSIRDSALPDSISIAWKSPTLANEINAYWYAGNQPLDRLDPYGSSRLGGYWEWLREVLREILGHCGTAAEICHVGTGAVECARECYDIERCRRLRDALIEDPEHAPIPAF